MIIETKYDIGDHIWVIYIHKDEICLFDDYITELSIDKDGIDYWCKDAGDTIQEKDIVMYEDEIGLAAKIKELMKEIREKEKENAN